MLFTSPVPFNCARLLKHANVCFCISNLGKEQEGVSIRRTKAEAACNHFLFDAHRLELSASRSCLWFSKSLGKKTQSELNEKHHRTCSQTFGHQPELLCQRREVYPCQTYAWAHDCKFSLADFSAVIRHFELCVDCSFVRSSDILFYVFCAQPLARFRCGRRHRRRKKCLNS